MARNLRFSEMSLEELLVEMHRMELIREDDVNGNEGGYWREIELHKKVLRVSRELKNPKINGGKSSNDIDIDTTDVKRKLSKLLLNHGSEMKSRGQGSRLEAEKALKEALFLDRKNGMAAYRLAFIYYRMNDYKKAIQYFNAALENTIHDEPIFCLSDREIYYARLYLMTCYLHEVDNLNDELEFSATSKKYPVLPNYASYGIKDFISVLGLDLTDQEYELLTDKGSQYISYEDAMGYFHKEERPEDTLIVWFDGVNSKVAFNQEEQLFRSDFKAKQLVYLLRFTSQNNPGNEHNMQNCFEELSNSPFVTNDRLRTAISKEKRLISSLDPELDVISTSRSPYPSGYYYNKKVPYMIICRSEEASLLYK